ncbi:MAG: 3-oxoacyl-ACP reductase [Chloroflexi bacterium]|nr:3-oxoacyl-ACP reductase [Chloroflexota bacterium]|tara:strand:- start:104 stop:907 length:804 start_codon:yes stop_codon:yes gene_type:complete
MSGRVEGKVAVLIGGGQTPGETVGNGRATALVLAREGARVFVVDRDLESANETAKMIKEQGGIASSCQADVTSEEQVEMAIKSCVEQFGRLDILHNNVGASVALKDGSATELETDAFDQIYAVNLRGMWLPSKHALPVMREQNNGSIINISSMAVFSGSYPFVGYKTTKAAIIALTENIASANAEYSIRANTVLPGLINTPMAIEARVTAGADRVELVAQRDGQVPLGRKMGTGWDIANASLFLHSDEAQFITGIALRVDGGRSISG